MHTVSLALSCDRIDSSEDREPRPAGDRLSELYRCHGADVYRRCRRLLGDHAAAEDATQETFLRVQRHWDTVPDDEEVRPWLYRIATNLCLNARQCAHARLVVADAPPERSGPSLEELVTVHDLVNRVAAQVSPPVWATARYAHIDGFGQEEIAQLLGVTRRTVANRLAKFAREARRFLRRQTR